MGVLGTFSVFVVAALPDRAVRRLRVALAPRFVLVPVAGWEEMVEVVRRQPVDMAVCDPALEGEPRAHEVERLLTLFPSLPVVLYTALVPEMVPIMLRLGRAGVREAVLAYHDEHWDRLRRVFQHEATRSIAATVRRRLGERLGTAADDRVRHLLELLVHEAPQGHSLREAAHRSARTRRTWLRWCRSAGAPPPGVLLTAIRVLYAHYLLQDPGYTVEDVAARMGYAQVRSLAANVREVFGMTPGELRVRLTVDEAVERIGERYFTPGMAARALAGR